MVESGTSGATHRTIVEWPSTKRTLTSPRTGAPPELPPSGDGGGLSSKNLCRNDLNQLAAAACDEATAQDALVRKLYGRVRKLARSLSASAADAEDLAQQTLLELLRSSGSFLGDSSIERWVDRITLHCARGATRKHRHRTRLLERWLLPDTWPWGAEGAAPARDPIDMARALRKLSSERREVLLLRHAYGYSVNEIADILHTPRGTIKDRLVAGKKQLRRSMMAELRDRGWLEHQPPLP